MLVCCLSCHICVSKHRSDDLRPMTAYRLSVKDSDGGLSVRLANFAADAANQFCLVQLESTRDLPQQCEKRVPDA